MNATEDIPKVLVVDDGKEITDLIYNYSTYYKRDFLTLVTNHPEEVMGILERNPGVRIIVTDFRMPGINGLDLFFKVRERYPQIQFIMMTGFGTPELRSKAEKGGFVRYLEKPFRIVELIKAIRETLERQARGFKGYVPSMELPDIVQLLALSGGEAALEISAGGRTGKMHFRRGELVNAECGELVGTEAFMEIATWRSGQFVVSDLPPAVPRTISESWQGLLLEAARRQDESGAAGQEAGGWSGLVQSDSTEPALSEPGQQAAWFSLEEDGSALAESAASSETPAAGLGVDDLESVMEGATRALCDQLHLGDRPVSVRSLPVKELPPPAARHLVFQLHWASTSAFRFEDSPFNLEDPAVARAAREFLRALLDSWELAPEAVRSMVREAVQFHLARSLHPAAAIGEFATQKCAGNTARLVILLTSLLEQDVLEEDWGFLVERARAHSGEFTPSHVEGWVSEHWRHLSPEARRRELTAALARIAELAEIAGRKPPGEAVWRTELVAGMLEARGMEREAQRLQTAPRRSDVLGRDDVERLFA